MTNNLVEIHKYVLYHLQSENHVRKRSTQWSCQSHNIDDKAFEFEYRLMKLYRIARR